MWTTYDDLRVVSGTLVGKVNVNIPILPEALLTFASKSSVGPSLAANEFILT